MKLFQLPWCLASGSPRRRQLLEPYLDNLKVVIPQGVDEVLEEGSHPGDLAVRLAQKKAEAALEQVPLASSMLLAADTIVATKQGKLMGKPVDRNEAKAMLEELRGSWHQVFTGYFLAWIDKKGDPVATKGSFECTEVEFADVTQELLSWYVATGDSLDKAGAYGIQGVGEILVKQIRGNYSNVMGLPIHRVFTSAQALMDR